MEWNEVKDPNGQFVFNGDTFNLVASSYVADEIQAYINEMGVIGMVRKVNSHFAQSGGNALVIGRLRGHEAVLSTSPASH